jgi:transposase InsO family protein
MTARGKRGKPKRVSHPSHRPWKSLRDSHIPTASTTSSYEKARPNSRAHRINNFGWAKLNRRSGPSALAKRTVLTGVDFFTVEVLTWRGLATYYVLFFVQLETRRITLAGITRHPTAEWMLQMSRNATDEESGHLHGQRYLLHDRDTKFCPAFRDVLRSAGVRPVVLPPQSPNLNAFAERWVRSVKQECLSKLILFGEVALHRALTEYTKHYHTERNHQGKENKLLFPKRTPNRSDRQRSVRCEERLGGLLKYYRREAA